MNRAQLGRGLSEAALKRVAAIGGWDAYGARWAGRLETADAVPVSRQSSQKITQ